jgi:O-antigen/teichoic acid export membrane protein
MTLRVAVDDREGALRSFQSSWILLTAVSFALLLLTSFIVWWVPWGHWLRLSSISAQQASYIMLVLVAYIVVGQQSGLAESGFRCDGNFATGTSWAAILRLAEAVLATLVAVLGGSLLSAAFTYLAVRSVGTLAYAMLLRHKSPWLSFGVRHARLGTIRELAGPALGFVALPAGNALNVQGLTVVIGASLGPVAVVAFSTMRTLTRVTFQLLGIIARTLWPELSSAFGSGDIRLARNLHRRACQAALGLSLLSSLLLWAIGPAVYRFWIRSTGLFDPTCFHMLLIVIIANTVWYTSSVVPMSTNAHRPMALAYLGGTAVSLGLAWVLAGSFGIAGAALALLLIDAWMSWLVLRAALRQTEDTLTGFVSYMFGVRRLVRPQLT